jgi:uncharacterized protein
MIERALYQIVFSEKWGRQMRFISGPRQTGKTTLAKWKLELEKTAPLYYLWDLRSVRNRYRTNEFFFTTDSPPQKNPQWVCFDEMHKIPKWKNILKGIFDECQNDYHFIITGSAKLDLIRRTGDTLSGRYFVFHLMPVTLTEWSGKIRISDPGQPSEFIREALSRSEPPGQAFDSLLEFGGFPEPLVKQEMAFHRKWIQDYAETIIQQDIGALTRITEREYLHHLYSLLPEMIGSPVSEMSLASHIGVSPVTIRNYIDRLEEFFLVFRVRPWSKNIKRALLRSSKCYLFDWTQITDPGLRFENYLACELFSRCSWWNDSGLGNFSLWYIRTRDKQEIDFLITRDKNPWLLVEAKSSDSPISSFQALAAKNMSIPLVQVCRQKGVARQQPGNIFHISAARFLG